MKNQNKLLSFGVKIYNKRLIITITILSRQYTRFCIVLKAK